MCLPPALGPSRVPQGRLPAKRISLSPEPSRPAADLQFASSPMSALRGGTSPLCHPVGRAQPGCKWAAGSVLAACTARSPRPLRAVSVAESFCLRMCFLPFHFFSN